MDFAIISTISALLGVILGANFEKLKGTNSSLKLISETQDKRISNNKSAKFSNNGLDEFEKRFLSTLIENENSKIDVSDLNRILRLEKMTKENQRQRRHIFLKELNIKLRMHFNNREIIQRIPSEIDGRVKIYTFNQNTNLELVENLLKDSKSIN
jgi:uncharacterized membrane protein